MLATLPLLVRQLEFATILAVVLFRKVAFAYFDEGTRMVGTGLSVPAGYQILRTEVLEKEFPVRDERHCHLQRLEDRIALTAASAACMSDPPVMVAREHFLNSHAAFDNTTDTARPLGELRGERNLQEYVGLFDPIDVYQFSVNATSDTTINLTGMVADADVYLLNVDRATIASSTRSGGQSESIDAQLAAGDYFVVVKSYDV